MNSSLFGIFGASGCGRGLLPIIRQQLHARGVASDAVVFIDDNPPVAELNGQRVLRYEEFLDHSAEEKAVALCIANSTVREQLANRLSEDGLAALSVIADNVEMMDEVEIEEGACLSPFVTLTSNIRIGRFFHANLYSYVEHDCVIGDFVTFAPRVMCNGNVVVEDHAYIGAGAVIKQGQPGNPLVIGRGATIGMGAVVTRSVPAGSVVVGNPARPISGSLKT